MLPVSGYRNDARHVSPVVTIRELLEHTAVLHVMDGGIVIVDDNPAVAVPLQLYGRSRGGSSQQSDRKK